MKMKQPPVLNASASKSNTKGNEYVMGNKIAFFDIDHSVADAAWRDHLLGDWDTYHEKSIEDESISAMVALIDALYCDQWTTIGLTGRPERWRQLTEAWLLKRCVMLDELIMRPNEVYDGAAIFKQGAVRDRCSKLRNPLVLVFDDRDDVIGAMQTSGVNCVSLQVHAGANSIVGRPPYVAK
jgi:hypothetical protein